MADNLRSIKLFVLVGMVVCATTAAVQACPVCFGDPNSEMVKGAQAGVMFMVGVIYTVLLGLGGFMAFWIVRARRFRLNHPDPTE